MIKRYGLITIAGVAAVGVFASTAMAGHYPGRRGCDCYAAQQCASWQYRNCGNQVRGYRWYPEEVPDNTEDPWTRVPFDPDKVWERIQLISPG